MNELGNYHTQVVNLEVSPTNTRQDQARSKTDRCMQVMRQVLNHGEEIRQGSKIGGVNKNARTLTLSPESGGIASAQGKLK